MRVSLCFLLGVWQETVKQQARNFSRLSLHLGTHTHTSGTQGKTVKEDLQATVCTMFSELVVRQAVSKNTDPPYMCKATKTNFSPFFLYWGSGQVFLSSSIHPVWRTAWPDITARSNSLPQRCAHSDVY